MSSDELVIDLTNYRDRVGSRVPPARYRVQVEDIETTKSNNGNPMVILFLRIVGGEFDSHNLVDRLVLTENAMFRVVNFMQAVGQSTPKKQLKVNPRNWIGKVIDADVEDGDPYNGRVKSEVRGYTKVAKSEQSSGGADLDDLEQSPSSNGEGLNEFAAETSSNPDPSPQSVGTEEDVADDEGATTTEDIDLDDVKL